MLRAILPSVRMLPCLLGPMAEGPLLWYTDTRPRPKVYQRNNSIGIDTGCVYGGYLTAYIVEKNALFRYGPVALTRIANACRILYK